MIGFRRSNLDPQNAQNVPVTRPGSTDIQTLKIDGAIFPIFKAVQKDANNEKGVRLLIDASGQQEGYFAKQSWDRQDIELNNARTMPLLLVKHLLRKSPASNCPPWLFRFALPRGNFPDRCSAWSLAPRRAVFQTANTW
jgi:hypothetical protein